ncbi:hypothetical protein SAMN04488033_11683 [Salegentibacter agarivorans]|uniref:Uncharacterized protein n=1 Tax=Salegentibacter agarivorans TaxID=345907 RepID=A0A1I2MWT1_9FLAO|nr:hypothetical protein SAMN04488033_11683 [Salegentibacter agarivorans]
MKYKYIKSNLSVCHLICHPKTKNPVNIVLTGLLSGVGGDDRNFNFIVFTRPPKGARFIGHRIGLALTNFNVSTQVF